MVALQSGRSSKFSQKLPYFKNTMHNQQVSCQLSTISKSAINLYFFVSRVSIYLIGVHRTWKAVRFIFARMCRASVINTNKPKGNEAFLSIIHRPRIVTSTPHPPLTRKDASRPNAKKHRPGYGVSFISLDVDPSFSSSLVVAVSLFSTDACLKMAHTNMGHPEHFFAYILV